MLCDHLEGWEGNAGGRGCRDVCMHIADSLCCTMEANTALWSNCTPIKMLKKLKNEEWLTFIHSITQILSQNATHLLKNYFISLPS